MYFRLKTKARGETYLQEGLEEGTHPALFVVELVHEKTVKLADVNLAYHAGIDIDLDNLVTLTSNKPGFESGVQ